MFTQYISRFPCLRLTYLLKFEHQGPELHCLLKVKEDLKIVSEYDQEIPQSKTADSPVALRRKSRSTITRHQEDKLSKATSSLFPFKMIAILERTQSNVQQHIEQLRTPTMGVTINKKSTTTEPLP